MVYWWYVLNLLTKFKTPCATGIGGLLIGDKGYLSSSLQQDLSKQALNLQTPKRSNMVESRDRHLVRRLVKTRRLIETVIGQLAQRFHFKTVRARDYMRRLRLRSKSLDSASPKDSLCAFVAFY